jgi:hypothetical protein
MRNTPSVPLGQCGTGNSAQVIQGNQIARMANCSHSIQQYARSCVWHVMLLWRRHYRTDRRLCRQYGKPY